jgi:hypothetical protein
VLAEIYQPLSYSTMQRRTLYELEHGTKNMKYKILLVIIIIYSSCQNGYRRYVPVYVSEDNSKSRFVERPDSLTPQHIEGIKKVFAYYRIPFRMDGNMIYYKGTIEQELLWNYSLKASDKQWLETHN